MYRAFGGVLRKYNGNRDSNNQYLLWLSLRVWGLREFFGITLFPNSYVTSMHLFWNKK